MENTKDSIPFYWSRMLYYCLYGTEEQAAKQSFLKRVRIESWDLSMVVGS